MIRRIILTAFFWLLMISSPVFAQNELVQIDSLIVNIEPEYDRSDVLIIYDITFTPETPLQSVITIHIPLETGRPHAVAYYGQDGALYDLSYDADQDGDWLKVSFLAPTQQIRLEYYDPTITRRSNRRTFVYRWSGDYIVNTMKILVQQPRNATYFDVQPDMGAGFIGNDGLTYYQFELSDALQDGRIFSVTLNYDKPDDTLSAQLESVEPIQPLPEIQPRSTQPQLVLPWVLGGLGVLLIAGGWYWYWRSGQSPKKSGRNAHRRSRRSASDDVKTEPDEVVYCHKCGKRAAHGDRFCRDCGTQLYQNGR